MARTAAQTRHCTDTIEEALYEHRKSLFGAISVAFFDTTSLYFEGDGGATLGHQGHSKDFRPQLNQVVLGIVPDEQDRPIASFLWPGNTADVTTLLPVVERLCSCFGVERACIVADRGMISAATITALEARKIDYILGARERSSKEVRETVLRDDGVGVPLTIPRQKGETDLAVKEVKVEGRRYIVCRNEEEARKDAETRATLLAGLQRKLARGAKGLVGNTGYRRFLAAPEGDGFAIDPAKVEADARFDGVFVLRASLSMSALAVVLRYRNRLTVEQSFLAAKALPTTRPVFHRTDAAIRGHVFCTFLALVLREELLDRLAAAGGSVPEWQCIMDDLLDLSDATVLRRVKGPVLAMLENRLSPIFCAWLSSRRARKRAAPLTRLLLRGLRMVSGRGTSRHIDATLAAWRRTRDGCWTLLAAAAMHALGPLHSKRSPFSRVLKA
jgi:hypothetical protein